MNNLERHLEAARGWLLLGDAEEAAKELAGLDETNRLNFDVLLLHARVCRHRQDWTRMLNVARLLTDARPDRVDGALTLAMATRHLHGPDRALGILMDAVEDYPDESALYYALACCEALSGNVDLARGWLNEAHRLAPELGKVARVDVDLAALRAES